jgi:hypothetical protein
MTGGILEGQTNWLIHDRQWQEILKHPALRAEDFELLNLVAIMARYLIRPPQLKEERKYKKIRAQLQVGIKQIETARNTLRQIIENDDLFAAVTMESDLLQVVFGIFAETLATAQGIRQKLRVNFLDIGYCLVLLDEIKMRLGGPGRKGNDALSFIIRFLIYFFYLRLRKPLSRSNEDICLVCQLYKSGAYGSDIDTGVVRDRIRDLTRKWNANEIEASIAKTQKSLRSPLTDMDMLAALLATNTTSTCSLKDWEKRLNFIAECRNILKPGRDRVAVPRDAVDHSNSTMPPRT